jgi:uncharacterized protein (UPF0332 family)
MKNLDFLNKLKTEGKLELVEPSEQMSVSYWKKSQECRDVAKLAFDNNYFESATTQAYYSMYNSLQSLFFKCGIKCESHSGAAVLLKEVFNLGKLHEIFKKAKEERIDKQYYVTPMQEIPVSKESSKEIISLAGKFILEINAFKENLKNEEIKKIREDFSRI